MGILCSIRRITTKMGFFELVKLFFSEDEEIVIPINDEEDIEYSCGIEIEEVEFTQHFECTLPDEDSNIQQLLELVDTLPKSPNGNPPEFTLKREVI